MKFSIITPTYKRKEKLERAVASLVAQTYTDWEMIIVNDSPQELSYHEFSSSINDARIHYHINETNSGVNYSRNYALSKVSADSKWVIFLDDDDYFAPDTLQTFHDLIMSHQDIKWFVTNRAYTNGKPLTKFPKSDTTYSYAWSYLISKRCKGDATHCIETKLLIHEKIHFSKLIKQAEEWFFFYQVGLHEAMYYHDHNSTITDGYDTSSGLNFRTRTKESQYYSLEKLVEESYKLKILYKPSFLLYITLRYIKILVSFNKK
jgi:glycosyltransferase involved in cell wall biosynthesis